MAAVDGSEVQSGLGGRIFWASLLGGLAGGAGDITYALVNWGMQGVPPLKIFQSVARGLLGRASFDGGIETGVLGGVLHFSMATVMALVFVLASLLLPVLRRAPIIWGMAYGGGIYLVMNYIVVPLSLAARTTPPSLWDYSSGLVAHIFVVGLPMALIARAYLPPRD